MSNAPRILVIRGGAIGDFIMTLPALGALRANWPAAHIEVLGYPHIVELVRGRHYADATRNIEARAMAGFFIPDAILDPDWKDYFSDFNLAISYLFDPDGIFAGNVKRCGVEQLIEASPRPTTLPAAEHYAAPLQAVALYVTEPRPRLYPSAADRAFAAQWLAGTSGRPLVAVHPGSGGERKNWPAAKFAEVCRWLVTERGVELLVVRGEADERAVRELTTALAGVAVTLVTGLKLVELAAVLERCAAFVGNDSGITHVAAAVGTPTVAVFGPASPAIWEPRGERVRVVGFGKTDVEEVQAALAGWLPAKGAG